MSPYMALQALADLVSMPVDEVPLRAEIQLQRPDGGRSLVAVTSGVEAPGGGAELMVESYPSKRGWRFRGAEGLGTFRLWIGEGTDSHGPLELAGGRLGTELPWTFVPAPDSASAQDADECWRFVAQGSCASSQPSVAIFVPIGWQLEVDDGQATALGEIDEVDGAVYEVTGEAQLQGPESRKVTIRTGQATESLTEYRLSGETFGTSDCFCGVPEVLAFEANGELQAPVDVEWRPVAVSVAIGEPSEEVWRPMSSDCLGQVELRVIDSGSLRFLERLDIVPTEFEVGLDRQGRILLSGLANADVEEAPGLECEVRDNSSVFITVEVDRKSPPTFEIGLTWDAQRRLTLPVPYAIRGAAFIGPAGVPLEPEAQIPVDRLSGIRAFATSLDDGESFALTARLLAEDVLYDVELYEPIPRLGTGYFEVDLGLFQGSLRRMLSASQELDAEVRLWMESDRGPLPPRRIQVARFEAPLELDKTSGEATVTDSNPGSELCVEALPRWQPEAPPLVLEATEAGNAFRFDPAQREAGPWMLLGWDGDICRFRPTLWTVGAEGKAVEEGSLSPLQQAIRLDDKELRHQALATEVARLAESPGDPGWAQVAGSIERQYLLPAAPFELLRELIQHPAAAVGALARASDQDSFGHAWSVLEQMPFVWRLVPLRAWLQAVEGLHRTRQAAAKDSDSGESAGEQLQSLLERMGAHRPYLKTVAAWLQLRLLGVEDPSELGAPAFVLEGILEAERQSLFSRTADDWWPRAPQASEWTSAESRLPDVLRRQLRVAKTVSSFKRPVLTAPLLAAFSSALDLPTQPFFLFDMRRLRTFDARFFDATYENGLRLALSVIGNELPK